MILRRIRLARVACFREAVEAGPFGDGLNVIAANNEEGKSTLVRAAARALFDRHTGKSQEIRNLQPAGTDLAPRVTVEFATAEEGFLLEKRFLQSAESRLYRKSGDEWELIAEGDNADQRVLKLVGGEQPGSGASKPQHWGLLRYLWARQDEGAAWPSWEGAAGQRIQAALARIEVDPVADSLEAVLWARFQECYTALGQVKRNGPLQVASAELAALEEELEEVREQYRSTEAEEERFRSLTEKQAALKEEMEGNRREAERLSEEARKAELSARDLKALEKARADTESRLQAVDRDLRKMEETEKELQKNREACERAAGEVERAKKVRNDLEERRRAAEATWKETVDDVRRLKREQGDLRHLLRIADLTEALAGRKELLEKVAEREKALREIERARAALPRVSAAALKDLRELGQRVRDLRNQLLHSGLTVSVTPLRDASVETETPEEGENTHTLSGGRTETFSAPRDLALRLPDWGSIEIRSGAEEVREKQEALREAEDRLASSLRNYGKSSVEDLEAACLRARELEAEEKALSEGMRDLLGQYASAKALRTAIAEDEASLRALAETALTDDKMNELSASELRLRETENEARLKSSESNLEEKGKHLESLREEMGRAVEASDRAGGEYERLRRAAIEMETRIKEVAARYGDAGVTAARDNVRSEFVKAEARLEEARKALPEEWETLPKRRERAVKAAEAARAEYERHREILLRLEGELAHRGSEGLYSRESRLCERIAVKRAEAERLNRRASAAGFLASLLAYRKREMFERVLAPLEEQLSARFGELTGRRDRRVFLDENLQVSSIGRARDEGIPFESLSQGAKEQLLLAMRAAVALELAGNGEPQVLILDDVLVNTDPTRQQRVLDFLETVSRSVQVLVLTCHPDRYRGVGTAVTLRPEGPEG